MKSGQGLEVEEVMAICGQREKSQCKDPEALDAWMCGDQSDAERTCMGLHGCDCNTAGISKQRCSAGGQYWIRDGDTQFKSHPHGSNEANSIG